MNKKFISTKVIVIPILTLIVLMSQMVPSFAITASELTELIRSSPNVTIETYIGNGPSMLGKPNNSVATTQKVETNPNSENFEDVKITDWYHKDVIEARKAGLVAGVGNNKYAPNSVITYAEYLTILARILDNKINERPDGKNWYDKYIDYAIETGIIDSNEVINPSNGIPREKMVKFTCKALKIEPYKGNETIFGDVKAENAEYINAAYKEYLTEGSGRLESGTKKFGIGELSTRAQLATMANRLLNYKKDPNAYKAERAKAREDADKAYQEEKERYSKPPMSKGGYTAPAGYDLPEVFDDGGIRIGVHEDDVYELNRYWGNKLCPKDRNDGIYWVREVIKSKFGADIANRVVEIGERLSNGNYIEGEAEKFEAQGYIFSVKFMRGKTWYVYVYKKK